MGKRKGNTLTYLLASLGGIVFLLMVWWLVSAILVKNGNYLLPDPWVCIGRAGVYLFAPEAAGKTYSAIGWTFLRLAIGFAASFIFGALCGVFASIFRHFERFMAPIVFVSRAAPTSAIVLVLVGIFFNFKGLPPYIPCFLVFLVSFPIIYQAFLDGIANEKPEILSALDVDGGRRNIRSVANVLIPDCLPYVTLGITQSLGLSMKVSIMSEIVAHSSESGNGIGTLIQQASAVDLDIVAVIAYSLIAILITVIIDAVFLLLKKSFKSKGLIIR